MNLETTMTELMREAGRIMLSAHLEEDNSDGSVSEKTGSADFVTKYDVAVQEFLINGVKKAIPNAVFIAEEKENDPRMLTGEACFVIDPIDGTKNFINGYRHSCISLAMISRGETVFAAVYDPYMDEMFTAVKGGGARLNGKAMCVSERPMGLGIAAYGTSPYYKDTLTEKTFGLARDVFLAASDLRRCGSAALDLAYLAAGRNDMFFEFILSPWDIAAGALLVTEAGGVITDISGSPIDLSAPTSVFAANKLIHPEFIKMAEKYR